MTATELLRSDPRDFWIKMRSTLVGHGVDPSRSVLAFSAPQGDMSEFAVVVAHDGRVYQCALYSPTDSWADAQLIEWVDLTASWTDSPYANDVRTALSLVSG